MSGSEYVCVSVCEFVSHLHIQCSEGAHMLSDDPNIYTTPVSPLAEHSHPSLLSKKDDAFLNMTERPHFNKEVEHTHHQ